MNVQNKGAQTGHCGEQVRISIFNWQVKAGFVDGKSTKWWDVGKEVTVAIIYLKYSEDWDSESQLEYANGIPTIPPH